MSRSDKAATNGATKRSRKRNTERDAERSSKPGIVERLPISARIDRELVFALRELARITGVSQGELIAKAVRDLTESEAVKEAADAVAKASKLLGRTRSRSDPA